MKIRSVYRPQAAFATPSTTLRDAAVKLRDSRQSCLPVVDGTRVAGILTERDIVVALAHATSAARAWVLDYMHDGPISVGLDDDCRTAELKMLLIGCRHLPVVDRGRLVGMVSMRDVVLKPIAIARHRAAVQRPR